MQNISLNVKPLSAKGISFLIFGLALIAVPALAQSIINLSLIALNIKLSLPTTITLLQNMTWINLIPKAVGLALVSALVIRSHLKVDAPKTKRQITKVSIIALTGLMLLGVCAVETPFASAQATALTGYILDTPLPIADWYIGTYGTNNYFAINGSNWDNLMRGVGSTAWSSYSTNYTKVEELVLASVTSGSVYIKDVPFNLALMGNIPENVQVICNYQGVTYTYANPLDTAGSPYTVSVGEGPNTGYYLAADSKDRILWSSTNRTYVESSVITALTSTGGTVITQGFIWDSTVTIPSNIIVTSYYQGKIYINCIEKTDSLTTPYLNTENINVPVATSLVRASHIAPNGTWYVGLNTGLYKSTDKGATYSSMVFFSNTLKSVWMSSAQTLFASANAASPNASEAGLWRYGSGGWSRTLTLNSTETVWLGLDQDTLGNIFCGVYGDNAGDIPGAAVIYKSTDDGLTWTQSYYDPDARHIHDLTIDKSNNYIYAAVGDNIAPYNTEYILRSTDNGGSWSKILDSMCQITNIVCGDGYRLFSTDDPTNSAIYRSTDDTTFTTVYSFPLSSGNVQSFWMKQDPITRLTLASFIAGTAIKAQILISADEGLTWQVFRNLNASAVYDGSQFASNFYNGELYYSSTMAYNNPQRVFSAAIIDSGGIAPIIRTGTYVFSGTAGQLQYFIPISFPNNVMPTSWTVTPLNNATPKNYYVTMNSTGLIINYIAPFTSATLSTTGFEALAPSNLANIVDGDWTTAATAGEQAIAAQHTTFGRFIFNFTTQQIVQPTIKASYASNSSGIQGNWKIWNGTLFVDPDGSTTADMSSSTTYPDIRYATTTVLSTTAVCFEVQNLGTDQYCSVIAYEVYDSLGNNPPPVGTNNLEFAYTYTVG